MDAQQLLTLFDRDIRQNPAASSANAVEREPGVVRVVSAGDGWRGISWCDLEGLDADAVIAGQIRRFAELGQAWEWEWEWKHYSHDRPADLAERLLAAGFEPDPVEALLVAEIAALPHALTAGLPPGTTIVPVTDAAGAELVVRVHDEVFGGDHTQVGRDLAARLAARPGSVAAAVVMAGDRPICAGRVEFHTGTDFASLWGGGTVADWRGRGVFRALVAHRAALAAAAGYRYLQVDASADSRPILLRLGFRQLATTTPYVHTPTTE